MPHLSELHGAATHLAVVAIPVYLLALLCRRSGLGGLALAAAEPWVVVSARDVATINAYLQTLGPAGGGE